MAKKKGPRLKGMVKKTKTGKNKREGIYRKTKPKRLRTQTHGFKLVEQEDGKTIKVINYPPYVRHSDATTVMRRAFEAINYPLTRRTRLAGVKRGPGWWAYRTSKPKRRTA